jgi:hypothetical protein
MNVFRGLTLLALVALLAGCSELPKPDPLKSGPFFTPVNVKSAGPLPAEVKRVVLLPSWGGPELTEQTLDRVDTAEQTEVTKTNRFETVVLSRETLYRLAGKRSLSSVENLPAHFLERLTKDYGADAVLFSDVTSYSPYPPLVLGLRCKLARLSNGDILWAADNVFSAAEAGVTNSARKFARELGADRGPADLSHAILQNPSRFAAYVSAATFSTLPSR